jgi:hypothetical protein
LKRRNYLEDLDIDGSIILKWIFNSVGGCGLDSCESGKGSVMDCCEHGNDISSSIKGGEFLVSSSFLE